MSANLARMTEISRIW